MHSDPALLSDEARAPDCRQLSRAQPDPETKDAAARMMSEKSARSCVPCTGKIRKGRVTQLVKINSRCGRWVSKCMFFILSGIDADFRYLDAVEIRRFNRCASSVRVIAYPVSVW